jgi:hypothetical protein
MPLVSYFVLDSNFLKIKNPGLYHRNGVLVCPEPWLSRFGLGGNNHSVCQNVHVIFFNTLIPQMTQMSRIVYAN